ncbi:MAG: response regulator transcription factor [Clostridia bacterium]|nr:response regulator transcription factor [Clostridia bacterium]MBN2883188.1 response regulator transcription factor [Clostridia bacterium]
MTKKRVYVLEDEINIQHLIKYNLDSSGFATSCFTTGRELFNDLQDCICDLLILDIMLPDTDGYEVLSGLKKNPDYSQIPVIMLTAKKEELDKVLSLEMGADDYITKPFSVRELTSRVRAVLRRTSMTANDAEHRDSGVIRHFDIEINKEKHQVLKSGQMINLSLKEYGLLELMMSEPGKVFSRDKLLNKIWGYDYYGETRTVDVHIRYLRRKLNDNGPDFKYIDTVRGLGYKVKV